MNRNRPCCKICGVEISLRQYRQYGTCQLTACRQRHHRQQRERGRRQLQEIAENQQRRLNEVTDAASRMLAIAPDQIAAKVVPANMQPLALLPAERRESFRSHLAEQLRDVAPDVDGPPIEQPEEQEPNPIEVSACTACAGHCCTSAGDAAYLTSETLTRFMSRHPELAGSEVIDAYLQRIPETTFDESCVYHGEQGCALPREMRADLCNTFRCNSLLAIHNRLEELHSAPVVALGSMTDRENKLERLAIVTHDAPRDDN